ncbi:hypothetical protein G7051_09890 [Dysgonomonas sp. HDW5B]|uniref:hypothetical protein n=1 Tax=Dysgonomonas sp. HDW5B TaxID=2714927 RepID=UPI00140E0DEF|nr:hypothetical protein [Dysgonomonas sp. HDW5B]QIK54638.1 hypothetical protein G7051_09890 [Dysgonomonas sp. HDW5B]
MKKIKIYVSVLMVLGASFAFTSCVDDSESSSVKEVREAYANQLKAQAELSKAQIEASKIKAEAEALLIQAQIDQVKSQTKLNDANAALLIAQTDVEKKKAEADQLVAAEELKSIQARVKLELEEYKYKLEQVQIVAEIEMLKLQAELDKSKNQQDEVLNKAINDYKVYIGEVNSLKKSLAKAELDLVYQKAILSDLKTAAESNTESSIRLYNNWIINTESQIANDKKLIASWNQILTNIDATKLEKEIAEKTKQYQALLITQATVYKNYTTARATFENGAKKDLLDFQYLLGKYYTGNAMPNNMTYYSLTEINTTIAEETKKTSSYQALLDANNIAINKLKAQTESLYVARNKTKIESDNLYTAYEVARDLYYNNSTSENYNKMNAAYEKYRIANSAYDSAYNAYYKNQNSISNLEYQNSDLSSSLNYVANALAKANRQKAAYAGDANKAKVLADAYTAAEKIYNAAYTVYVNNDNEVRSMSDYLQQLNTIYYSGDLIYPGGNSGIWTSSIEQVKKRINELESRVLDSEAGLAQYKRDITNAKELNKRAIAQLDQNIKNAEAEIAALKTLLPVAEKQASDAKAIVDARMK